MNETAIRHFENGDYKLLLAECGSITKYHASGALVFSFLEDEIIFNRHESRLIMERLLSHNILNLTDHPYE